jgi:hypothetical protein
MVSIIIFSVLVIVLLLLILLVVNAISIKMDYLNKDSSEKKAVNETPEFQAGVNHAFSLVQICLYKMWSDQDILDFDSLNDNIKSNLMIITNNPDNFKKWHEQYTEYLKNKNTGDKDD